MVSSDVVFLGSMLSQARHFLCSKQDIPCVPSRTRLKNREDGSDFHDFLTKSIASPRTFFLKIFAAPKIFVSSISLSSSSSSSKCESHFSSATLYKFRNAVRKLLRTAVISEAGEVFLCGSHMYVRTDGRAYVCTYVRACVRTCVRAYVDTYVRACLRT